MISQQIEHFVYILRGNCRSYSRVLDFDGDEFFFVLPFGVILEPIIQVMSVYSPSIVHMVSILNTNGFHFAEQNGFGCHEWNVVLFYQNVDFSDCYVFVLVQNFQILCHFYYNIVII